MITENENSSYFQDSIIRHASLHGDVVELLKNRHQEKIVFLRFNSDKLNLRYGIYIGINMDDFFKKYLSKKFRITSLYTIRNTLRLSFILMQKERS